VTFTLHQILLGNQVKEDEMRDSCNIDWGDEKYWVWSENQKGRDHSEDLGTDGMIILEGILWK